jgi:hypothetical protein
MLMGDACAKAYRWSPKKGVNYAGIHRFPESSRRSRQLWNLPCLMTQRVELNRRQRNRICSHLLLRLIWQNFGSPLRRHA